MVYYCCVKGCRNNSNRSKKNAQCVSFHVLPSKPALRQKWLRAIGRPHWEPSSHVRICSAHFDSDSINLDGNRVRITENAYPVKGLPPNANFEASGLKVCRFCLATEVKMYSLQEEALKMCIDAVAGFDNKSNIEGLPQYTCYECKANLHKCYGLIEKSRISQATLLDIFAQNEQITKPLVRKRDRKSLNLISSLSCNYITPSYIFEYTYNEIENVSNLCRKYFSVDKQYLKDDNVPTIIDNELKIEQTFNESYFLNENVSCIGRTEGVTESYNYYEDKEDNIDRDFSDRSSPILKDMENQKEIYVNNINIKANDNEEIIKNTSKRKRIGELTSSEFKMQEYFTIVKLSLQEQIEEFKKTIANQKRSSSTVNKCEVCCITYSSLNAYETHIMSHNPVRSRTRGVFECPVCKKRFKHKVEMTSHAQRMHGKKFICKFCPKSFHRVSVAKSHHLRHAGHRYQCPLCAFCSAHASALGVHARTQHAHAHACARCGHAFVSAKGLKLHRAAAHRGAGDSDNETDETYRCAECGINFKSEGARRVHVLTSQMHKNKNSTATLDPPAGCRRCGVSFPSATELRAHARAAHASARCERAQTGYPRQCEHCPQWLSSRQQRWQHSRRAHRGAAYPARVAGLCHTCGKGFQNTTKLRMHLLRHSSPTYSCAHCPRVLHDAYALQRHAARHAAAKHQCAVCKKAFTLKGNLVRHARVHTGEAPYECGICHKRLKYSGSLKLHIRTVHRRLPPPPRNRSRQLQLPDANG